MSNSAWPTATIASIALAIKDGSHGSHKRITKGVPLLSAKNITASGRLEWDDFDEQISEDDYRSICSSFQPLENDVLITIVGTLGRRALFHGARVAFQRSVAFVRPDPRKADPRYLYHAVGTPDVGRQLLRRSNATAQAGLYLGALGQTTVPVPPLAQQRGIAEIVDAVDRLIDITGAVISKLQDIRAGALQDLLTRGVDDNGELRDPVAHPRQFKDSPVGKIPREWEVAALADTAASEDNSFTDGDWIEAPHIRTEGIRLVQTGNIGIGEFIEKPESRRFISSESFQLLGCKPLRPGDVLICRLAEPVGRACLLPAFVGAAITSVDVTIYRPNCSRVSPEWATAWLNSNSAMNRCEIVAGGTTRKRISRGNLGKLPIAVPPLAEQGRCAGVLACASELVEQEMDTLRKIRLFQSGLMTDLLTGRVRVPGELTIDTPT